MTLLIPACSGANVKEGDTVQVNYEGKLADGTVFDSSTGRSPLMFIVGKGEMIPGFEKAVIGMKVGEKKVVTIAATDAYGPWQKELTFVLPRVELPTGMDPQVGQQLQLKQNDDSTVIASITKVSDENVTVDTNNPLAGKDLIFEIELVEIR